MGSACRTLDKLRRELATRGTRLVIGHCNFDVQSKIELMGILDPFEETGSYTVLCIRDLHDAVKFAESGHTGKEDPDEDVTVSPQYSVPPMNKKTSFKSPS